MRRIVTGVLLLALIWASPAAAAAPRGAGPARPAGGVPLGGVVGNGTPESCTTASLNQTLGEVQNLGGGLIEFNCGAAPHTFAISPTLVITTPITVDGGALGNITLDGGNSRQVLRVAPGAALTLTDLVVTNGWLYDGYGGCLSANSAYMQLERVQVSDCQVGDSLAGRADPIVAGTISMGGAIGSVGGTLVVADSQVLSSTADSGGGIYNTGQLVMTNTRVAGNNAGGGGGLIVAGSVSIANSLIEHNQAGAGGGLATFTSVALNIAGSRFYSNTANTDGGGLYSQSVLTLTQSTLDQNQASDEGGGLYVVTGTVSVSQTVFSGNGAHTGGGVFLYHGRFNLIQGWLDANTASDGGGLANDGAQTTLFNVTLSHNHASADGGGFYDTGGSGYSLLTNVTVSSNSAGSAGGGIKSIKPLTLTNVTIANNTANVAGGFYRTSALNAYSWRNVLIAANLGDGVSQNCNDETPTVAINSLSSDATCGLGGGANATLPLGPLAYNGGDGAFVMLTHLPLAGSAAINGGTNSGIPLTDQRGAPRPAGGVADVGAVESDALTPWLWLPLAIR
jgi:predicted outer membrane repeat protein